MSWYQKICKTYLYGIPLSAIYQGVLGNQEYQIKKKNILEDTVHTRDIMDVDDTSYQTSLKLVQLRDNLLKDAVEKSFVYPVVLMNIFSQGVLSLVEDKIQDKELKEISKTLKRGEIKQEDSS